MRRLGCALLLWLLPAMAAAQGPRFESGADGVAWLRDLPPLLAQPEVRKKLDTGLTTSFEFTIESGGEQRVFALLNVRFEPWDEVYQVSAVDSRGRFENLQLASFAALADFWRDLRLAAGKLPRGEKVRLLLEVLPFSQREQNETQRWFSDSLAQAGKGTAEGAARSGEDSNPEALGQALSVLMATSIERRSAFSYRFSVPAPVVIAGSP